MSPVSKKPAATISLPNVYTFDEKISYIGPRALFDPNFIPSKVIPREKSQHLVQGILTDAIQGHYATNITLYGLKGVGKNLMASMALASFEPKNPTSISGPKKRVHSTPPAHLSHPDVPGVYSVRVDCTKKDINQLFFQILLQLCTNLHYPLENQELTSLNTSQLWNMMKLIIQNTEHQIILYLKNADELEPSVLGKFFVFAKSTGNLQILTSLNYGAHRCNFKQFDSIDHQIPLDLFDHHDLYTVTSDRSIMAFQKPIVPEAIQTIVDYISEFDIKTPGSCINFLKATYPVVQNQNFLHPETLRELGQYHFEGYSLDALTMADFVMTTTLEDRLFLDNVVNYFQHSDCYYIPFCEIKKAYLMASEEMGFKPYKKEFYSSLNKILNAQIIRPSRFAISSEIKDVHGIFPVPHFLTLPLNEVSEIMKVSFGDIDNSLNSLQKSNANEKDSNSLDSDEDSDEGPEYKDCFD